MPQKTISKSFSREGPGIHSGKTGRVAFYPAETDTGICFMVEGFAHKISPLMAVSAVRGTTLEIAGRKIAVVEHLLSAISGLGLDNLRIEVEGEELPALDGSALGYARGLLEAGIVEQRAEKKFITLEKEIQLDDAKASIKAVPYNGFRVSFVVNFAGFPEQKLQIEVNPDTYVEEIAPARTFGYLSELEELKRKGLALGASPQNSLALGDGKYINQPRFADELVRHKMLDLIGDLALLNQPLKAHIFANMSGHRLNIELAKKVAG